MIKNAISPISLFISFSFFLFIIFCSLIGRPENREWAIIFRSGPYTQQTSHLMLLGRAAGWSAVRQCTQRGRGCVWGKKWASVPPAACLTLKQGPKEAQEETVSTPFVKGSTLPWGLGMEATSSPILREQGLPGFLGAGRLFPTPGQRNWEKRKGGVCPQTRLLCVESIMFQKRGAPISRDKKFWLEQCWMKLLIYHPNVCIKDTVVPCWLSSGGGVLVIPGTHSTCSVHSLSGWTRTNTLTTHTHGTNS